MLRVLVAKNPSLLEPTTESSEYDSDCDDADDDGGGDDVSEEQTHPQEGIQSMQTPPPGATKNLGQWLPPPDGLAPTSVSSF